MTWVAFALLVAAGHGVLRLGAGRWPHRAFGPVGSVALSWFAGVAALGVLTTMVGVAGGPTRPLPVAAPVLAVLAVAGVLPPRVLQRRQEPVPAAYPGPNRAPAPVRLGDAVAGVLALAVTVRTALLAAPIPVHRNDEYALWVLRARAMSQLGRLDPRVFTDTGAGYQHLDYPLFLPSLFGWLDGWAGQPADGAAHVAVATMVGALVAVAGATLTRLAGPAAATAALLLVLSVPTLLSDQALSLMADLAVFGFALGLALALLRWLALDGADPEGRCWLVAAAVLGAGAIGTKAEGVVFTGTAFLAALVLASGRRRGVLLAGAAAVLVTLPWQAYARAHQLRSAVVNSDALTVAHLREVLPWTGTVLRSMATHWPGGSGAGLVLLAAVVPAAALAARAGAGRLVVFVGVVVGLDAAVLAGQYVLSALGPPGDPVAAALETGLLRVTVYRVALVPATLLAVAVPVFAGLALRPARPQAPEPAAHRRG